MELYLALLEYVYIGENNEVEFDTDKEIIVGVYDSIEKAKNALKKKKESIYLLEVEDLRVVIRPIILNKELD